MGILKETEFSMRIEQMEREIYEAFVEANGRLTINEYERLESLRYACEDLLKVCDSLDSFEQMKELVRFNREQNGGSQA